ncbi:hypothetical protein HK405_010202 [Cladochytrium tenue]|nr:hypothetical protein HK405_010202 [Cladochytrium tenue]
MDGTHRLESIDEILAAAAAAAPPPAQADAASSAPPPRLSYVLAAADEPFFRIRYNINGLPARAGAGPALAPPPPQGHRPPPPLPSQNHHKAAAPPHRQTRTHMVPVSGGGAAAHATAADGGGVERGAAVKAVSPKSPQPQRSRTATKSARPVAVPEVVDEDESVQQPADDDTDERFEERRPHHFVREGDGAATTHAASRAPPTADDGDSGGGSAVNGRLLSPRDMPLPTSSRLLSPVSRVASPGRHAELQSPLASAAGARGLAATAEEEGEEVPEDGEDA